MATTANTRLRRGTRLPSDLRTLNDLERGITQRATDTTRTGEDKQPTTYPTTTTPGAASYPSFTPLATENTGGVQPLGVGTTSGSDLMTPWTGFSSAFLPSASGQIFDNPQVMLMQAMQNMGMPMAGNIGTYQMAAPQTDYANALAFLALGGQGGLQGYGATGDPNMINWMGNYLQQGLTPGGMGIDFTKGLSALQGAIGGGGINNPLASLINSGDPSQQIDMYKRIALPLAAASLHPLAARAFQNAINMGADQYLYNTATNPNASAGGFGGLLGGMFG